MKTQKITSNVYNSLHILYTPPTNSAMINDNSIKKRVTASNELFSDCISALFGGTEKKTQNNPWAGLLVQAKI
jgi:hypothetical protein